VLPAFPSSPPQLNFDMISQAEGEQSMTLFAHEGMSYLKR
jgi:hypothetical protein